MKERKKKRKQDFFFNYIEYGEGKSIESDTQKESTPLIKSFTDKLKNEKSYEVV